MNDAPVGPGHQHGVGHDTGAARGMEEGEPFTVDGVEFVPAWSRPSRDGSLTLLKSPRMVDAYAELFASFERPRIVELGISQGGSVALFALMARPTALVAFELSPDRIGPLDRFVDDQGLGGVVAAHHGVDQADKPRVTELVDAAIGDAPLDLVIDDASHRYTPTVASFECLFPAPPPRRALRHRGLDQPGRPRRGDERLPRLRSRRPSRRAGAADRRGPGGGTPPMPPCRSSPSS